MIRWLVLLLFVSSAGACTTFDPVARNTCGNGVLEPGEDCDSNDASCVRCAVTCTKAADCPTDAYSCGTDGVCHAPGGALGPAVEAGQFFVDDMRITDIDHDGIGDVVGASRTSLVVRHGDPAASLTRTETQFTPSQPGPASFADLDGDGSIDVSIATPDGLVSYASPYGVLSPLDTRDVIVDGMTGAPLDARMIFSIPPTGLGAFVAENGVMAFEMVDVNPLNPSTAALPCGTIDPANFSPDLVDVYPRGNNETIIALTSKNGGKLCVLDVNRVGGLNVAQLTGANAPVTVNKPVLADLDNDGDACPDVITSDGGPGALMHRNGTMAGGHCTLGLEAALPPVPGLTSTDQLRGHVVLSPVPLGVVPDALVFEDSIWGYSGSAWGIGYTSPRPIAGVLQGDLDGDGMLDVLLTAEGTDDIDILYRNNALFASFDTYRLDTIAPVTAMTLGDFDDDGNTDIDYIERVGDHVRMMVAYGAGSRPTPPIEVGTFPDVTSLAPIFPELFNDSRHQLTDMIVLSPAVNGGSPAFTFLLGSAQRSLLPIFDPRPNNAPLLRSAIVASYTGDGAPDVFPIATYQGGAMGWQLAGPPTSFTDMKRPTFVIKNAVDCSHAGSASGSGSEVCVDDALYIAWPGAQHDQVLEVDHEGHAMAFDPAAAVVVDQTAMTGTLATTLVDSFTGHMGVHTLARVDIDGTTKLLAAFGDAVLLCPMGSNGAPSATCDDITTKISDAGVTCSDAAAGHFGFSDPTTTAGATDLVALCHAGGDSIIYRIHDGTSDVLLRTPRDLRAIRIGDITGDGIDDIVAIAGEPGDQSLVAFPQCSSRTLATCQVGAHP